METPDTFYIVDGNNYPLSQFDGMDHVTSSQLKFRTSDCITFSSKQEADSYLAHVQEHCEQKTRAGKLRVSNTCKW